MKCRIGYKSRGTWRYIEVVGECTPYLISQRVRELMEKGAEQTPQI